MRVLLIFIDGVGLGKAAGSNPLYYLNTPGIASILGGQQLISDSIGFESDKASLLGLDATLNVPGLPQSATGQAAIFTGENAAALVGEHINGYPEKTIRDLLYDKSLFKRIREKGFNCCFANAYRPAFFEMLELGLPGYTYSCSTLASFFGGLNFFSLDDIRTGGALYMDITNRVLLQMGFDIPIIEPEEGAKRLLEISKDYDFCMFEYFLSDIAGHTANPEEAEPVIETLDRFIGAMASDISSGEALIMFTSDHGNLEDLATREHTYNKVPLLLIGSRALRRLPEMQAQCLTDVLPAIIAALQYDR